MSRDFPAQTLFLILCLLSLSCMVTHILKKLLSLLHSPSRQREWERERGQMQTYAKMFFLLPSEKESYGLRGGFAYALTHTRAHARTHTRASFDIIASGHQISRLLPSSSQEIKIMLVSLSLSLSLSLLFVLLFDTQRLLLFSLLLFLSLLSLQIRGSWDLFMHITSVCICNLSSQVLSLSRESLTFFLHRSAAFNAFIYSFFRAHVGQIIWWRWLLDPPLIVRSCLRDKKKVFTHFFFSLVG